MFLEVRYNMYYWLFHALITFPDMHALILVVAILVIMSQYFDCKNHYAHAHAYTEITKKALFRYTIILITALQIHHMHGSIRVQVVWKWLYSVSSGMDSGTLYQLSNLINRRKVHKDTSKDVNASEDFILTVHILSAVMQVFEMTSLDDVPSSASIPSNSSDLAPHARSNVLLHAVQEVIETHVDLSFSVNEEDDENTHRMEEEDNVYEYARETLSLGLLMIEFLDATREGDGTRTLRCWRYLKNVPS